jgi:3-dehydroquinate synthase
MRLRVDLGERGYDILIARPLAALAPALAERLAPSRLALVADQTVADRYAAELLPALQEIAPTTLLPFPPGESAKCQAQLAALYDGLVQAGLDRKSAVVALGGGVTGDLAGYAAATFLRGIPFVQAPTSLLAMVDSSVGGKTGINHPAGKNLIGAFHQPSLVCAATDTLATLPREEFVSGLAEVVKHGAIRDPEYFALVEEKAEALLALTPEILAEVVAGSCRIKAEVVAADERESGLRAILNFGHTLGHAIEAVAGYGRFRHGEAVSIGMVAAARLGEELTDFPPAETARLQDLLQRLGLPTAAPGLATEELLAAMGADKKAEYGRLRFILPRRLGAVSIETVRDEAALRRAVDSVLAPAS